MGTFDIQSEHTLFCLFSFPSLLCLLLVFSLLRASSRRVSTQDIYSNGAFPSVDGIDLWPSLVTNPAPLNSSAAHPAGLWLSAEVWVAGDYKLIVAQQDPAKTNSGPTLGWKCGGTKGTRCNTTVSAECGENPDTKGPKTEECDTWVKATAEQCTCGCQYTKRSDPTPFVPCVFDVANDVSEFNDVSAAHSALRTQMWAALNRSNLELYMHRADTKESPDDPTANRSPAEYTGPCNATCADAYWRQYGVSGAAGPLCGVPGCT